jgi:hypothetical protein
MGYNGLVFGAVLCVVFSAALAFLGLWGPSFIRGVVSAQIDDTLIGACFFGERAFFFFFFFFFFF